MTLISRSLATIPNRIKDAVWHAGYKVLKHCIFMPFQASIIAALSSVTDSYCLLSAYIRRTRMPHRFSIGFRSGEHDGHARTSILLRANHIFEMLLTCTGALSCWKISWSLGNRLINGRTWLPMTCWYSSLFIFVEGNPRESSPSDLNTPHTITKLQPNTVGRDFTSFTSTGI